MSMIHASKRWRRVLLATWTAAGLAWTVSGDAQGLDLDAGQGRSAPPGATQGATQAAHQSGGLDMDVNPDAPLPPKPAVTPAASRDSMQEGIAAPTIRPAADPANAPTATPPDGAAAPVVTASPAGGLPASAPPASIPAASGLPGGTTSPVVTASPAGAPPGAPPIGATPNGAAPAETTKAAAAPAAPEPVTLEQPKVIDTARLQSGDTTVSLYGIEGLTGEPAQGLQSFLAAGGNRLTCQAHTSPGLASTGFVCLMPDGTDVAQVALVNGAARAMPDAPDTYREQEAAAQTARRGIWVNLPPPPETVLHPVVHDTATLSGAGKTYVLDGVVGFAAPYNSQLQGYIGANGDSMTCSPQSEPGRYICVLPDGTDIAKVSLVNGAARVAPDAPDSYRVQQADALNNHRGYWLTASQEVMTAALLAPPQEQYQYALAAGDDGADGISYIGGAPVALIDGAPMFLVFGAGLGWGYYDHFHHWRGAPDRFRDHMERFHPGGRGLRGYEGFRGGREIAGHPGFGGRPELVGHPGMAGPGFRPGMEPGRPGAVAMAGHPGMEPGRPGAVAMGGRPGFTGPNAVARPGMAGGGGFMHPGAAASMGGFHPGAPAVHAAAPAVHAAAGGGVRHK
jgi:endonuclease YncB( thermonuclease family)